MSSDRNNTEKSLFIGVYVYICIHIYMFLIKPFYFPRSWSLCNNVIWSDFTVVIGKAVIPDQENNLRNMWTDIELLTNDDTGSGYLSVGSGKEHGTALYQVDLLAKISSEKVMVMSLFSFTKFLLCLVRLVATW